MASYIKYAWMNSCNNSRNFDCICNVFLRQKQWNYISTKLSEPKQYINQDYSLEKHVGSFALRLNTNKFNHS